MRKILSCIHSFFTRPAQNGHALLYHGAAATILVLLYGAIAERSSFRLLPFCVSWLSLFLLLTAFDLLFSRVWRQRILSLRFSLSSLLPTFALGIDAFHYGFFKAHVDSFALGTAYEALRSGELHFETWWGTCALLLIASWLIFSQLLVRLICLLPPITTPRPHVLGGIACLLALLVTTQSLVPRLQDQLDGVLPPVLSWTWLVSEKSLATYQPPHSATEQFDIQSERTQFHLLERKRKELLAQHLAPALTPHIVLIHIESLRADMLTPEYMPFLSRFRQQCLAAHRCVSPSHMFSTGNNTGLGVFGMLTGLSGYYYHIAKRQISPPLPVQLLRQLGYRISFFRVTDWGYDDLYPMFFAQVVDRVYDKLAGRSDELWRVEQTMTTDYLRQRRSWKADERHFDYLTWYVTHYNYVYAPEFEIFKPVLAPDFVLDSRHFSHLRQMADRIKNRYLNSVRFADHELETFFSQLRATGALENTIVVITGDHGEEFWEQGRFGHTFGLNNEQTKVAFLMHFPASVHSEYDYASLTDVMPTIFDYMGLAARQDEYMTGKSLLRFDPQRNWTLTSMGIVLGQVAYTHMVIGEGFKIRFRNEGVPTPQQVTDLDDHELPTFDSGSVFSLLERARLAKTLPMP